MTIETDPSKVSAENQSCRDCGATQGPWYWYGHNRQKLKRPRCRTCHEQAMRHQRTDKRWKHDVEYGTADYPRL